MTPVQPGGLDDTEARRKRMRMGILGAAIGLGIPLIILLIAVIVGLTSGAQGSDQWIGAMLVLLAGTILSGAAQIIGGIVLAAIQKTRPFGVGFLIGSATGIIVMAGACFTIPAAISG